MMEERYHATTQNRFHPDMCDVNKNITVEAKLISPRTYYCMALLQLRVTGVIQKCNDVKCTVTCRNTYCSPVTCVPVLMCSCTLAELKNYAFCFQSLQTFVDWWTEYF